MHPSDCEPWEYKDVHNHKSILMDAAKNIYKELRKSSYDSAASVEDSRLIHESLFRDLVPPVCHYFAGHYRGEDFRCLKYYKIGVQGDPRVGYPPESVHHAMGIFSKQALGVITGLDGAFKLTDALLSRKEKIRYAVIAVCKIFVDFLTIHPYANGNGHIARFFVTAILGRYGLWTNTFPVEPRPADPPYSQAIASYRDGNLLPLEQFVLRCIGS